jgi:hypothetical protein
MNWKRKCTCTECGFLASGNKEVTATPRHLLDSEGNEGLPDLTTLDCHRSLWAGYELLYIGSDDRGEVEEVNHRRRCVGFVRYIPGLTPAEHMKRMLDSKDRRIQLLYTFLAALLAAILALFGQTLQQWAAKRLSLSSPGISTTGTGKK